MRFTTPHPRPRVLLLALALLAIVPTAAGAAPKKVRFSFLSTTASVRENAGTYTLRINRSGNTKVAASVHLSVTGTAVAGTNYTFTNPVTVNFASGEVTKTFPVTIIDNTTFDPPNKTIIFTMSGASPGGSMIRNNPLRLTILDDDGPGTIDLSTSTYSVVESAGAATITVTRIGNPAYSLAVPYSTSDGSATAGSDYTATSGTVTFAAGEMSETFQVPITDDQDFEGDENLTVTLGTPQNLTLPSSPPSLGGNSPASLTIVDDDVPTFSFSSHAYTVNEPDGHATITVNRGGATYVPADVAYSTTDGTAIAGSDYTAASGTLHFDAGQTTATFDVPVTDDSVTNEGNETVNLHLSFQGDEVDTALLSIVDDNTPEPSVQFSTDNYSVDENGGALTVTATLSKPAAGGETVDYATGDSGSLTPATAGTDYTATSGTLTFTAGQTSQTFQVPITDDPAVEDDEDFNVTLSNPSNLVLGAPNPATATIVDNDDFGLFQFSKQRYDVNETGGHVTVTVQRVGGSGGAVSVDYATSDGSATSPADYAATSGTLTFADGETSKTFDIPVAWDGRPEGDESLSVDLSNPTGGSDLGAVPTGVVHIADDGASQAVQFSAAAYNAGEKDGSATITVNRVGAGSLGGPVTVDYAGSDGTHGTLTFGPGDTTKAVQVPIVDDNVHTGTRTINLSLANPGGGTSLGSLAAAALNIADDEPASSSSTDKTAPKLTITAKKLQKALKTKKLVFKVKSNEAASLKITVKYRKGKGKKSRVVVIRKASKKVAANKTVKVTLKLTKKQLRTLRKGLVKGKVKVTLSVKGTDAAGNSRTVNKAITAK
jgi:hypothetical protein